MYLFNKRLRERNKYFYNVVEWWRDDHLLPVTRCSMEEKHQHERGESVDSPYWSYYDYEEKGVWPDFVHRVHIRPTLIDPLKLEYVVYKYFGTQEPVKHHNAGHICGVEIARFGRDFEAAEQFANKCVKLEKYDWEAYKRIVNIDAIKLKKSRSMCLSRNDFNDAMCPAEWQNLKAWRRTDNRDKIVKRSTAVERVPRQHTLNILHFNCWQDIQFWQLRRSTEHNSLKHESTESLRSCCWDYAEIGKRGFWSFKHTICVRPTQSDPLELEFVVEKHFRYLEPVTHKDFGTVFNLHIARFGRDFDGAMNFAKELANLERYEWAEYKKLLRINVKTNAYGYRITTSGVE
ncbi:MAG: hypothetical protein OXO49_00430 [Gammaproteobacteria bacterium]|nr:hypothetical protein [Gammaproteobacteria bacterium]MDE0251450.1 hypothetical protein [Gammaproteobacteria bacterium]MDE0401867.1 hypothetical protein [Gammaproteobacteria bacterium]